MGCQPSRQSYTPSRRRLAQLVGHPPRIRPCEPPVLAPADPRLPLNERQVFGITKSWKAISRNMTDTAVNMFVRLFETNEEVKNLFTQFRGMEHTGDLRNNAELTNHALMVMCTVDEALTFLDDMDYTITVLSSVGRSHRRFANFNTQIFYKIEEPFLLAVKETLGDRYTLSMELAYKQAIRFILDTLAAGFTDDPPVTSTQGDHKS